MAGGGRVAGGGRQRRGLCGGTEGRRGKRVKKKTKMLKTQKIIQIKGLVIG